MKARLLALAAFLTAVVGGVYFMNFNDASVDRVADNFGALEIVDRSQCVMAACNAAPCQQAANIIADAGSACVIRFLTCPFRLGPRARNLAADAGLAITTGRYQQIKLIVMRCAGNDGGAVFGVPVTDAGWPSFVSAVAAFPCAWKNPDAGATCMKIDGGDPGLFNTMQPGEFAGVGCQAKACVEFAGESSAP